MPWSTPCSCPSLSTAQLLGCQPQDAMVRRVKKRMLAIRPSAFLIDFFVPIDTRSGLEKLPPELYSLLLYFMEPSHAVLLSLTCKQLWGQMKLHTKDVLYQLHRCTKLRRTIEFLTLVEKDNASQILCTACLKWHYRLDDWIRSRITNTYYRSSRKCSTALGSFHIGSAHSTGTLPREAVGLILRAPSGKPEYDLPIELLNIQDAWKESGVDRIVVSFAVKVQWHLVEEARRSAAVSMKRSRSRP